MNTKQDVTETDRGQEQFSAVFRSELQELTAYKVADAQGYIKLDAMENPYSWPDTMTGQWLETLRDCPLNRYPDPQAGQLKTTIRKQDAIPENCELLFGNGSDEIIQLLLMALPPDAAVLAPEPTFVMYRQIACCLGLKFHPVPLQADSFALDMAALRAAIEREQPAIIFLAYPNNPTGNLFAADDVAEIIRLANGLVILDEAYAPFARASFLPSLPDHANLLVMRTVSKLGLAGLRLGYIAGRTDIINELDKLRLPYNINIMTQITTDFALTNRAMFDQQTEMICQERTRVFQWLDKTKGLVAYPSAANFILFRILDKDAGQVFNALKEQGVLIKNLASQGGLLANCLRVTIGKPDENDAFLAALENSLAG